MLPPTWTGQCPAGSSAAASRPASRPTATQLGGRRPGDGLADLVGGSGLAHDAERVGTDDVLGRLGGVPQIEVERDDLVIVHDRHSCLRRRDVHEASLPGSRALPPPSRMGAPRRRRRETGDLADQRRERCPAVATGRGAHRIWRRGDVCVVFSESPARRERTRQGLRTENVATTPSHNLPGLLCAPTRQAQESGAGLCGEGDPRPSESLELRNSEGRG